MTKDNLIRLLKSLEVETDRTWAHREADKLLLEFIDDERVTELHHMAARHYA